MAGTSLSKPLADLAGFGLPELSRVEPEIWSDVMRGLSEVVEQKQFDRLAVMANRAQSQIAQVLATNDGASAKSSQDRLTFIRAKMTLLAIEQFIAAFFGGDSHPSFKDRLVMSGLLLPALERGQLLTQRTFDRRWSWVSHGACAASMIQKAGFWSIPTTELCRSIKNYTKDKDLLEVGAGRGLFVSGLRQCDVSVIGIDDHSWEQAATPIHSALPHLRRLVARDALRQMKPKAVLSVWPPPGNIFERDIFATDSVEIYLAIVSKHRFASGNWADYQSASAQTGRFRCVISEPLNHLLRPIEAEQQLLVFRR